MSDHTIWTAAANLGEIFNSVVAMHDASLFGSLDSCCVKGKEPLHFFLLKATFKLELSINFADFKYSLLCHTLPNLLSRPVFYGRNPVSGKTQKYDVATPLVRLTHCIIPIPI